MCLNEDTVRPSGKCSASIQTSKYTFRQSPSPWVPVLVSMMSGPTVALSTCPGSKLTMGACSTLTSSLFSHRVYFGFLLSGEKAPLVGIVCTFLADVQTSIVMPGLRLEPGPQPRLCWLLATSTAELGARFTA